jgi:hypothetical protein
VSKKLRLIASPHHTKGYGVLDDAIALTRPGMADFVDLSRNNHCRDCLLWERFGRGDQRRCTLHTRLMGRKGPTIDGGQRVCRKFEAKPLAPPKSAFEVERDKFLDPDSWRRSKRDPENRVRAILGTDPTVIVTVFRDRWCPGQWSWVVRQDGGGSVFSSRLHLTRDAAVLDVWEKQIASLRRKAGAGV